MLIFCICKLTGQRLSDSKIYFYLNKFHTETDMQTQSWRYLKRWMNPTELAKPSWMEKEQCNTSPCCLYLATWILQFCSCHYLKSPSRKKSIHTTPQIRSKKGLTSQKCDYNDINVTFIAVQQRQRKNCVKMDTFHTIIKLYFINKVIVMNEWIKWIKSEHI